MEQDKLDAFIREKANSLDGKFPEGLGSAEMLWNDLSVKLDAARPAAVRKMYALKVAASVALLGLFSLVYFAASSTGGHARYTTENVASLRTEEEAPVHDQKLLAAQAYIEDACRQQLLVCQQPEFVRLHTELQAIETKMVAVQEQLAVFHNDPAYIQAQIAIENQRAYLLQELIFMLRS